MDNNRSESRSITERRSASSGTLIYERTGIRFCADNKYLLESRLSAASRSGTAPTPRAYYHSSQVRSRPGEEMTALYNVVTTSRPPFSRDMHLQLSAFAEASSRESQQNGTGGVEGPQDLERRLLDG